uniref:BURP domain-containing protein 9-like isoform X2 n=1 Tax=Erigeron canadensis TaxID=72917 RepID=UPI001CB8AC9C|nr:BURP domain-containing protein 9-like isoform X2 [Erigeron canadensis]
MMFNLFLVFTIVYVSLVGSHAVTPEDYWKSVLPDIRMPKAIKELLDPQIYRNVDPYTTSSAKDQFKDLPEAFKDQLHNKENTFSNSASKDQPHTFPLLYSASKDQPSKDQRDTFPLLYSTSKKEPDTFPLLYSASKKEPETFPLLYSASKDQVDKFPLLYSVSKDQPETFPLLYSASKDQSSKDQRDTFPLLYSTSKKEPETFPLLYSTSKDQPETFPLLYSASKDQLDKFPLLYSASKDQPETFPLLYSASKDQPSKDQRDTFPLLYSASKKEPETFPLLYSASKDQVDKFPLLYSVSKDQPETFPLLYSTSKDQPDKFPLLYSASKEQPSNDHLKDDPNAALFFLENDLDQGKEIKIHLTTKDQKALLLPQKIADLIPFSSKNLTQIYNMFSVKPFSVEAEIMKRTLSLCEQERIEGEEKYCATSLESMVDFSTTNLGKKVKPITTEVNTKESSTTLSKYKIKGSRKLATNKAVVCHKLNYAYAVFYCHAAVNVKAYAVSLVGENDTKVNAVAVCHIDTSKWDPQHMAFQVLKVKPGGVPVCHYLPEGHVVWVPRTTTNSA